MLIIHSKDTEFTQNRTETDKNFQCLLVVQLLTNIGGQWRKVDLNEPDQPEFEPWGPNPTWLNPNLDPGGPIQPKIGFIWFY